MLCFYISINVGPFNNNRIMTKVTLHRGVGPMLNAFLMSIFMLNSNFHRKLRQQVSCYRWPFAVIFLCMCT